MRTTLAVLLLCLTACGGASAAPPDDSASRCTEARASVASHNAAAQSASNFLPAGEQYTPKARELRLAAQIMLDQPKCFTPDDVAQAKQALGK